jgi:hypothetical protein
MKKRGEEMKQLKGFPFEPVIDPGIEPCGEGGPGAGPGNPH